MKHKPLLRIVLMATACLFVFTAFGSTPQIIMTTTPRMDEIEISVYGTGTATINWGDGESNTYTLSDYPLSEDSEDLDSLPSFTHSYSTATTHTITITGNRITALACNSINLTALDVRSCKTLEVLFCPDNQLTSLDVSQNTALIGVLCDENQLTSLNVSSNTALRELSCSYNQLTSLNVSNCTALTKLYCDGNQLTSLDVNSCAALTYLRCDDNLLTSLDVRGCKTLEYLNCSSNQLMVDALNTLFGTLHNNTVYGKVIFIKGNPSTDCNQSIATAKGWTVNPTTNTYYW